MTEEEDPTAEQLLAPPEARILSRVDVLLKLREAYWKKIETRRPFEWKVGLAIWTAFAAFIGIVLTSPAADLSTHTWWVAAISAFILVSHAWWSLGMHRAHAYDKRVEEYFVNRIMREIHVKFPKNLRRLLNKIRDPNIKVDGGRWKWVPYWTLGFQVAITAILAVAAVLAIAKRTPASPAPSGHNEPRHLLRTSESQGTKELLIYSEG